MKGKHKIGLIDIDGGAYVLEAPLQHREKV